MSTKKRTRASSTEIAGRVEEVLQARLNGAEFHDLENLARERKWEVSTRTVWRYVEAADRRIEKRFGPVSARADEADAKGIRGWQAAARSLPTVLNVKPNQLVRI
jgi:hypothetical protein